MQYERYYRERDSEVKSTVSLLKLARSSEINFYLLKIHTYS